jgi:Na+/H+ antiporter NhaC
MGAESPFGYFPRHVALLVGIASALILAPGVKISEKVDVLTENMGRSGVMMIVLIYLMASGFQGAAAAIGGKTSVINLCLHYIPVKLLVPGVFMMCCFISTAIGTSMGTMAAMAPVALGVAEGAGLNAAIVCAAVIGGSYFGDNLSMISDTTIAAAEGCGSEMRDKFRMNFFIAFPAAVLSLIFYGFSASGVKELSTISTAPPEKEKPARIGRATVIPAVIPANRACTTYSPGARNIKENSIGSVTPVKKEQNAAEAKSP